MPIIPSVTLPGETFRPSRPHDTTDLFQVVAATRSGMHITFAWTPGRLWADDVAANLVASGVYPRVEIWDGTERVAVFGGDR